MVSNIGSRRSFIGAAALALAAPAATWAQSPPTERPRDVGRKFQADGRVRGFNGDTVICHLAQQGAGYDTFDKVLDIYRDLPGLAFARKVTALPPSSYHMTIFGGANDQERDKQPWPEGVPIDAPIERVNAMLAERLAGWRTGVNPPFRMVVDETPPVASVSPVVLPLRPADAVEAARLKHLRDGLADRLRMRSPTHDAYQYHITIGYQTQWFTAAEQAEYAAALAGWRQRFADQAVVFRFEAPEYCVFDDMFAFRTLFELVA